MLDHPTHDLLRQLKLDGMADAFTELQSQDSAADMGHAALSADLRRKSPVR